MTCAHSGIPANGNMKPDSNIDGKKKKNVICITCNCVSAIVENVIPTKRFAIMKGKVAISNNKILPTIVIPNITLANMLDCILNVYRDTKMYFIRCQVI